MGTEKVAVFAVIFPANLVFFDSYLKSLVQQDESDFEVVLLVDQVSEIDTILNPYKELLTIHTYHTAGSVAQIREYGLNLLLSLPYAYIIFSDTDDLFSTNRVRMCLDYLTRYSLVVNDVRPFTQEGKWSQTGYWTERLGAACVFTSTDILRYNFVGLGNTSIRKELLQRQPRLPIPDKLQAPDWFIFFQLMQGIEAVFLQQGYMQYRQHGQNMAGTHHIDITRLQYILAAKINHYEALGKQFPELNVLLQENQRKQQRILLDQTEPGFLERINNKTIHYFWWEETEYMI